MTEKADIKSMHLTELTAFVTQAGEKPFRAKQLYQWMHQKLSETIDGMTNLSTGFRETLKQETTYTVLRPVNVQVSRQDGTRKYLFSLDDGNVIESVLMHYKFGNSVCVSSQAGCRMGCKFCASAGEDFARNLSAAEMLEQVYGIMRDTGERISHVVVMGIGEPLDNYDNLLRFIRLLTDENGLHISQRNLTVSTCGLVPQMYRLADEKLSITLALSLHAATQEKREALMPVAGAYDLRETVDACRYYFEQTGRRITFEYALVAGENDSMADAFSLASLIFGMNCHVNLIPVNPVRGSRFAQPDLETARAFQNKLEKNGIHVTIRREMGRDIDAACGQLRKRYMEEQGKGRWIP